MKLDVCIVHSIWTTCSFLYCQSRRFVAIFESRSCGLVKVHHFMMCEKWRPVTFKMCMKYDVLKHVPGLCAIDFRNVLKLVVHYALGWNSETKTTEYGPFGRIQAFYGAVEEQARKALHAHFIVWFPKCGYLSGMTC